ncbi:Methionine--tRNA ligase [uncultured archaeon]|nr:Methionine--tRNA ligase [uncultured archaeon]
MEITYDDFAKLELRIATILSAEKIEGADKLYKLLVDLGAEKRTLVAGIAQHYTPEELSGKQIVVVANLAPRALKGVTSQGMLLAGQSPDGTLSIVCPERKLQNGSTVR